MENNFAMIEFLQGCAARLEGANLGSIMSIQHALLTKAQELKNESLQEINERPTNLFKTLRDQWAMTEYSALFNFRAHQESITFDRELALRLAYRLADQAIAISKETGK